MPIPALFLHACLLSLSQSTGLIQSPLDSLPLDREPWENHQVGTRIVQKNLGFDSAGTKNDSSWMEIIVQPDRAYDIRRTSIQWNPVARESRIRIWGASREHPADSGSELVVSPSTGSRQTVEYRKQIFATFDRWIVSHMNTTRSDTTRDTIENSRPVASGWSFRRKALADGRILVDSIWKGPTGRPIRGTEASSYADTSLHLANTRLVHSWGWIDGHLGTDTVSGRGAQGRAGGDTTWTDTVRHTWEDGRLVRSTSAIDTVWMEWSTSGLPVHFLHRTWTPRFPSATTTRKLSIEEAWWDPQGRQTVRTFGTATSLDVDSMEYAGTSIFPIRSNWTYCTATGAVVDRAKMTCGQESSDLIETEVSNVALRNGAHGILRATIRLEGERIRFGNLPIRSGILELVSLEGRSLGQTPVLDGQATLTNPPRGVCLWRVRSPTVAVSEASLLILP